jgi:hypothetical protein
MLNVRIVALVVVALCAVSIPIKAVFVVRRILSPLKSKTTQQTHVTFGVCSLMYDVTTLAYGVLKIVDPKKFVIGNLVNANNAIDVVFFLNSSCYVPVLHCIVLNLSHFLLGSLRIIPAQYRDKVSATIDRVEHRAIYAPILGVVLSLFPFFGYASPKNSDIFNSTYLFGYWCVLVYEMLLTFVLATYCYRQIASVVNNNVNNASVDNSKMVEMMSQLNIKRIASLAKNIFATASWLCFTLIPALRFNFTYYYMLFFMISYPMSLMMMKGYWHFEKSGPKASTVVPVVPMKSMDGSRNVRASSHASRDDESGFSRKSTEQGMYGIEGSHSGDSPDRQ